MPDELNATPEQQAIRALAILCGNLLGTLREGGLLRLGDQERILANLEAALKADGPFISTVLDDVRWSAEGTTRKR
jgi:hypothetical protein